MSKGKLSINCVCCVWLQFAPTVSIQDNTGSVGPMFWSGKLYWSSGVSYNDQISAQLKPLNLVCGADLQTSAAVWTLCLLLWPITLSMLACLDLSSGTDQLHKNLIKKIRILMSASHVVVIRAVGKQQLFPTTAYFLALPCCCMHVKIEHHHKKDVFVQNWCQLRSLGLQARVTEPTFHCSRCAGGEADVHRCAVTGPNHTWWCLIALQNRHSRDLTIVLCELGVFWFLILVSSHLGTWDWGSSVVIGHMTSEPSLGMWRQPLKAFFYSLSNVDKLERSFGLSRCKDTWQMSSKLVSHKKKTKHDIEVSYSVGSISQKALFTAQNKRKDHLLESILCLCFVLEMRYVACYCQGGYSTARGRSLTGWFNMSVLFRSCAISAHWGYLSVPDIKQSHSCNEETCCSFPFDTTAYISPCENWLWQWAHYCLFTSGFCF